MIVTLDDATGQITSIFLTGQEGTMSSFEGLAETIRGHGLFGSLYTDRGSHYFLTQSAGGKVDKSNLTQVGRALAQLGIRHVPSYSPEARGRMERAFGTLQGRVPQELRLHGLTTMAAANVYLRDVFMADFNARFGVAAAEPGTAFVAYAGGPLEDMLCQQLDRQVGRDNCVSWRGKSLQIPPQAHRHHYVRATIRVHEYPDGRWPCSTARAASRAMLLDRSPSPGSRMTQAIHVARANRQGCGLMDNPSGLPTTPQPQHHQPGRTFDPSGNPDIFTRYRQQFALTATRLHRADQSFIAARSRLCD